MLGALDSLEGFVDEMLPGLDQNLDGHIVRDVAAVNEGAEKFVLRLGGRGKPDFDFLYADVYQRVEELQLFLHVHWIHQRLVAIPKVYRAPDGRGLELLVGPGAAGHPDGNKGNVLFMSRLHSKSSCNFRRG